MSIAINIISLSTNQLPNGTTTSISIQFSAQSFLPTQNVNIIVSFEVSPFPELNISGHNSVSDAFAFTNVLQVFTKTISVTNKANVLLPTWAWGLLEVMAMDPDSKVPRGDNAQIFYK